MKLNRLKRATVWWCILLSAVLFCACSGETGNDSGSVDSADSGSLEKNIVCTTYSAYDWVMQILGEEANDFQVSWLLDSGVDLHNYQPSTSDIAEIGKADLFIYIGGESEDWVKAVLDQTKLTEEKALCLMDALGEKVKLEEPIEGMQEEGEEHGHDHDHETESTETDMTLEVIMDHSHGEHGQEAAYDEHIWLSLKNAMLLLPVIEKKIEGLDADNAAKWQENLNAYMQKLETLDQEYEDMVQKAKRDTIVVGDRFPFRYLVDDYGILYSAAFLGCSAETEASFETISYLANQMDDLGLPAILIIDGSKGNIANTVLETTKNANREILLLDSLQAVSKDHLKEGYSYLFAMKENLKVLEQALND